MDIILNNILGIVTGLAGLVVVGQAVALAVIILLLLGKHGWIAKNALTAMLIVAIVSTLGSLFLSEIAGWTPCKYCWIQRIFMYPQVVILAVALRKNDRSAPWNILILSVLGVLMAGYHVYVQMAHLAAGPNDPAYPCDASGESCATTPFLIFGYVTIPVMALTAFILNALGSIALLRQEKA